MTTTDTREALLGRAVVISLFSWRRAESGDLLDDSYRMGWWGDTFPSVANDRIGSRLWLLRREKVTAEVMRRAEEYAREALQWMLDDELVTEVDVAVTRNSKDTVAMVVTLIDDDGRQIPVPFDDLWQVIHEF